MEAGTGNGTSAKAFEVSDIFRTGHEWKNFVSLHKEFKRGFSLGVSYQNRKSQGFLPENTTRSNQVEAKGMAKIFDNKLELNPRISFNKQQEDLPQIAGNWSNIFQAALLTPPTFDNSNRQNKPWENSTAFLLADGNNRSFAPQSFDNPFGLLNFSPDRRERKTWEAGLNTEMNIVEKLNAFGAFNYSNTNVIEQFGVAPNLATFANGRLTERNDEVEYIYTKLGLSTADLLHDNDWGLELNGSYFTNYTQRDFTRKDGNGFSSLSEYNFRNSDDFSETTFTIDRQVHETTWQAEFDYESAVFVRLGSKSYHSSTLSETEYFLPHASLKFDLMDVIDKYSSLINQIGLSADYSESVKEADLTYNSWHFNSTQLSLNESTNFHPQQELIPTNLLASKYRKWDFGGEIGLFNYKLQLGFNYFHHLTENDILPVWNGSAHALSNYGEVVNKGFEWRAEYDLRISSDLKMNFLLNFSRTTPEVKALYGNTNRVQIAGFNSVSTSLVEGEPYGAIVGTAFGRNAEGKLLIDSDGFPQVASEQKIIGNPNPDFNLNFLHTIKWRGLDFSAFWAWQKGGEAWNGTQQALDYYGKSERTESERNITNYLFDGVQPSGIPNTTLVDFANPNQAVSENRWVRYGLEGVAEDYIEKTSNFRLKEVRLGYSFSRRMLRNIIVRSLRISVFAENLFVITPYSGVAPITPLFGYAEGFGLDYFNIPNTRRFGFSLEMKI